jgi:hypothetical protein
VTRGKKKGLPTAEAPSTGALQECGDQPPPSKEPTEGRGPGEHPLQEPRKDACGNQVYNGCHISHAHCLPGYPAWSGGIRGV